MEKERDWTEEERQLNIIYIRRGYSGVAATDMAQQEIEKRKIECGYPVETEEIKDEEVSEKVKSEVGKTKKKSIH